MLVIAPILCTIKAIELKVLINDPSAYMIAVTTEKRVLPMNNRLVDRLNDFGAFLHV